MQINKFRKIPTHLPYHEILVSNKLKYQVFDLLWFFFNIFSCIDFALHIAINSEIVLHQSSKYPKFKRPILVFVDQNKVRYTHLSFGTHRYWNWWADRTKTFHSKTQWFDWLMKISLGLICLTILFTIRPPF